MTFKEKFYGLDCAAETIHAEMDLWENTWTEDSGDPNGVSVQAACRQSDDPIFNLAAWLKYNFGDILTGEENGDWLRHAGQAAAILGFGQQTADAIITDQPAYTPEPVVVKPYTIAQREAIRALAAHLSVRAEVILKTDGGRMSTAVRLLSDQARELGIIASGCDNSGVV